MPLPIPTSHSVSTVIINDENETLLYLRDDLPLWTNIGGCIETGEHHEAALHREVMEETGLEIDLIRFIGDFYSPQSDDRYQQEKLFLSRPKPGFTAQWQKSEGVMLRWFPIDQLPRNIGPRFLYRIKAALGPEQPPREEITPGPGMFEHISQVKDFSDFTGLEEWLYHPTVVAKRERGALKFDPLPLVKMT